MGVRITALCSEIGPPGCPKALVGLNAIKAIEKKFCSWSE
ncbi:hypothetical protein AM1_5007 [Acaryochloris marina MBIC11017]|uniref:Uncharacterized protein n=1 Tax=Acaryochloris marina (strain MBIC 11017) TaxID=329726 RepID=B0C5W3_ACAM1|nr:hypothetical protein AM1_5007 [Acaryochloris marina MBIC11017]